MRRSVLISALVLAAVLMIGDWAGAQSGSPTFSVENTRIDLGKIKAGTVAEATFVFHNNGPDDVKIIKAKPS